MKHRLLVLTMLVALSALFSVTKASAAGWTFGVKAGATSATLHGNVSQWITLPNFDVLTDLKESRTGFAGGIFMNVTATPMFSVQVEALYTQKGGSGSGAFRRQGNDPVDADIKIELDYIEFPVVGIATFPAGPVDVSGYGGFSVGYNVTSTAVAEIDGATDTIDIGALVKGADLSVVLGLDLSFGVGSVDILADGRFEYSLEDINSAGSGEIRNGTFFFMAGVMIPTGF